jgi:hypothetical protein
LDIIPSCDQTCFFRFFFFCVSHIINSLFLSFIKPKHFHYINIHRNIATYEMKTVRFQAPENLSTIVCEITPARRGHHTWFARHNFEAFKSHSKVIAREMRLSSRAKLLEGSLQDIPENNMGGVDIVQNMLIQWSIQGTSCRGLERSVHIAHGKQRQREKSQSILAVLEAQERFDKHISPDLRADQLRAASELCTANARAFAHKMGIADATANFIESEHDRNSSMKAAVIVCRQVPPAEGSNDGSM